MPAPYSYDFRRKALQAVHCGKCKRKVAQMFSISRNTVDPWLKRDASTGECRPKTPVRNRWKKITDPLRFEEFVKEHPDKAQSELARLWGMG